MDVYLEVGKRKTFAGVIEWPGWCRSGRDKQSALKTLYDYGSRYVGVLESTQLGFHLPESLVDFKVIETLEGNATTDFGAPGKIPSVDLMPIDDSDLQRFQELLKACWQAFDSAEQAAEGQELLKGPRGGGRDLEKLISHVMDADLAYLQKISWNFNKGDENNSTKEILFIRQAILDALISAARGDLPTCGPRGGLLWAPRYFVRRVAWHVLDHAWEIEDRMAGGS